MRFILLRALFLGSTLAFAGIGMAAETMVSSPPPPGCVEHAAAWANVHPRLLRAIAWVESRGNSQALNWNPNGTYDVGLMQINSSWYYRGLSAWWMGLRQPCLNVAAASWVLRQCVDEYRYTWNAVGCYHAGSAWTTGPKSKQRGYAYIKKVQQALSVPPATLIASARINRRLQKPAIAQIHQARNDGASIAPFTRTHSSLESDTMNRRRTIPGTTKEIMP